MEFHKDQIIDKSQYTSAAIWCNKSGKYTIKIDESSTSENKLYRIVEVEGPSAEELSYNKRQERDEMIRSISWRVERYNEQIKNNKITDDTEEIYNLILEYRQMLRDITKDENFPNIDIPTFVEYISKN